MTISLLLAGFIVCLVVSVWLLIDWYLFNASLRATHEDPAPHYPPDSGWGSQDEQEAREWSPEDDVHEFSRDVFPVEPR